MNNEIEVKIEIDSFENIKKSLLENGWLLEYSTTEDVVYFDDNNNSWKERGVTIRSKKINNKDVFTVKLKKAGGEYRIAKEGELKIESSEKIKEVLSLMGIEPVFSYSKEREHWIKANSAIELDYIPQVAKRFIEIESNTMEKVEDIIKIFNLNNYTRNSKSYPDIIKEGKKEILL